jgi:putative transposon-encoded protein
MISHYLFLHGIYTIIVLMRRMKTKQIESTVTKSGNSGHIIVPKDWIGKEVVVKIKEVRK